MSVDDQVNTRARAPINEDVLNEFMGRFVSELGAMYQMPNVIIGDRLGLYAALDANGPSTSVELADVTATHERYIREWLRGQAAGGYVTYHPEDDEYSLSPEQSFALAQPDSPAFIPGVFFAVAATVRAEPHITEAFRTGEGFAWHRHHPDLFVGIERFFRPGYAVNLVSTWIPALTGVMERLHAGGRVADVGCGYGSSAILMAKAFPRASFVGSDYHEESVSWAARAAADAGVADQCEFEVASATTFTGKGYALVACFDSLHDMGDPLGAARHVREALAEDGSWMIVEPYASDTVAGNLNPVGRIYYNASTMLCVPNSLSQEAGAALGAQAGEQPIRALVEKAGFGSFRRVAETPFNIVYEARV